MFKLMNFSGDDIRLDEKAVSRAVTDTCSRHHLRVEGVAALNDVLTVICSSCGESEQYVYRVAQLEGQGRQELFAHLRDRYDNFFRTAGAFELADGIWLLTEKTSNIRA